MIERILKSELLKNIKPGIVIALFGARRTGKTVLMNQIISDFKGKNIISVQGDNLDVAEILSSQRLSLLIKFLEGYDYLFIDEAQKIPSIGINLKLIVDNIPNINVFVTGSSAFDLKKNIGEPLTGRGKNYMLFPVSQSELKEDFLTTKQNLPERLIFGSYPQVVTATAKQEMISVLESVKNGYLLKDILELDNVKDSIFVLNLLRLLAFQIGNDVSLSELANNLQVNRKTVIRYLELLEKSYIIFRHNGFSRNLRKEFAKSPRYYFWDNGIRNAVIMNFNSLLNRDDVGKLWENYCISERKKNNHYKQKHVNYYFWRTYDQKEIDLIEEGDGKINSYEFKWKKGKIKQPTEFLNTYKNSTFQLVSPDEYIDFIS